jgi:hypothetical protein
MIGGKRCFNPDEKSDENGDENGDENSNGIGLESWRAHACFLPAY